MSIFTETDTVLRGRSFRKPNDLEKRFGLGYNIDKAERSLIDDEVNIPNNGLMQAYDFQTFDKGSIQ